MNEDFSNTCRFCLNFIEFKKRIEITDLIRQQFEDAINKELKTGTWYPDFHCIQCFEELQVCLKTKQKFAKNQGILDNHFQQKENTDRDSILNFVDIKSENEDDDNLEKDISCESKSSSTEVEEDVLNVKVSSKKRRTRKG